MTGARSAADAPRPTSGTTGSCAYGSGGPPPDPAAIRGVLMGRDPHRLPLMPAVSCGSQPRSRTQDAIGGAGPRAEPPPLGPHQGHLPGVPEAVLSPAQ